MLILFYVGSRVDFVEVKIFYISDEKNIFVKKLYVYENLVMVGDWKRFFKKNKSFFF